MKPSHINLSFVSRCAFAAGCLAVFSMAAGLAVRAVNCSINWSTIDGGGGASTGGVYSVTGTFGQPDAGKISGDNYTLSGGFWGIVAAVQTPGAPWLSAWHSSWESPEPVIWAPTESGSTGFVRGRNPTLSTLSQWEELS
jgi:hypothetical protein